MPLFRADVQISVHEEDGESYLVLHDPFGFADGPIMVHADMLDVLQSCDGETTMSLLADAASEEPDGPAMMRLNLFLQQMDEMGFFESPAFEARRADVLAAWDALVDRPPVCAGGTYPEDPDELETFLSDDMGIHPANKNSPNNAVDEDVTAVLLPHIDFRVAPSVYSPGFAPIADHQADLVIMIGTSHYWSDDAFILTEKNFTTPLGTVQTDSEIVRALKSKLPGVASTDVAHKPEHSLELHLVGLQHLWKGRNFTIVPLLVTMAALESDVLQHAAKVLKRIVKESGRKALWLISGDLAHVGKKFGDDVPASNLIENVKGADERLLEQLRAASPEAYHAEILATDYAYRICGHAPTVLALTALRPQKGTVVAYDVWDEAETESAVSFASVLFSS
ncbi:MAG: AmmeMemoRadiSam system protein B [Candidatus Kapabacteria bacterium]|nr:AmmeMemoRadiSam system protein B [Candidatus Kapabacteria bacterium]